MWLLKEHKLCVQELQKLKTMIEDLHRSDLISIELFNVGVLLVLRYIDLIHQRGQALFNAYNDMRKRLGDVRNKSGLWPDSRFPESTHFRNSRSIPRWRTTQEERIHSSCRFPLGFVSKYKIL